jgi:hypothetical protein
MGILDMKLFAGVTLMHVIIGLIALLVLMKLWDVFKGKPKTGDDEHTETARCACGWTGQVSKFTRTCPKCNNEIVRG